MHHRDLTLQFTEGPFSPRLQCKSLGNIMILGFQAKEDDPQIFAIVALMLEPASPPSLLRGILELSVMSAWGKCQILEP